MANHNETVLTTPNDQDIVITRIFDAPRNVVWEAYTKAEHLKHWWGPTGWTLPICEVDFRVGGQWFYCMAGPDNMESCGVATYKAISEPDQLVYTDAFADDKGTINNAMPVATITVNFVDRGHKTEIISSTHYDSRELRDQVIGMGVKEGIGQTFDRLDDFLETQM